MKITCVAILVALFSANVFGQILINNQVTTNRKVIGDNNFRPVDANLMMLPQKYRVAAEAVGLMSMGCTGTHIGGGLVVSAAHCFDGAKIAKYRSTCGGVQVSWGVRNGKNPTSVSNCRQILVMELNNRKDYALFRVDVPPRAALRIKTQGRPALGTKVTIFSHPQMQPLMWSGFCEISRHLSYGLNVNTIHHTCDTNPGSSGAAILDATTLEVVGIHDGGVSDGRSGANYGTYIDSTYIPTVLQRLGYR
jgi:V8-like Glu-specific endopeptidase